MDEIKPQRPAPRSEIAIFADLRSLAQSDGALHELSGLVYRDWVTTYDPQDGRITNEREYRFSNERLNKNELMLLVGLMVQSESDRIYSVMDQDSDFAMRADQLLRELHDSILVAATAGFGSTNEGLTETAEYIGPIAREAIFRHYVASATKRILRDFQVLKSLEAAQNAGLS